jgi:hypothetical protein
MLQVVQVDQADQVGRGVQAARVIRVEVAALIEVVADARR